MSDVSLYISPKHKESIELVIDLNKAFHGGPINKGKLVKRQVVVKQQNGKTFTRMQWVDPHDDNQKIIKPQTNDEDSTYAHHEDDRKDMEKRMSNKFPVIHHDVNTLKNNGHARPGDIDDAKKAYHNGEKLPPVKINGKGEVVEGHHLVEMAKQLGLSHVPAYVMGETNTKKTLEDAHKEQTMVHDADTNQTVIAAVANPSNRVNVTTETASDVEHFKNVTAKRYTKTHIMNEARRQGIKWNEHLKTGERLEDSNQIMWMRAYQAITDHIAKGGSLDITHVERDVNNRMESEGWDTIHKHFLKVLDQFNGNKQELMDWADANGIKWKRKPNDPQIDWMYCATAIKQKLAKGEMVHGVRTRQKAVMEEANLMITPQIREMVKTLQKKHTKKAVMDRAKELGIVWNERDKNGNIIEGIKADNIQWMRAATEIQKYIARGNTFSMGDNEDPTNGMTAKVGDYGQEVKLSKYQSMAVDMAKRNSQKYEPKAQAWAMKALSLDNPGIDFEERQQKYDQLVANARSAKLMIHFDPFETLKGGNMFIDQLESDGVVHNNWQYGRVHDPEAGEIAERELFGVDYDDAENRERPIYGVLDLFNNGLGVSPYGNIALVMKDEVKKRTTGTHTSSYNLPYETNGKYTRSVEDPHHLLADRWRVKWDNPKGFDGKRKRYMDAVIGGEKAPDDDVFETHTHGGIDLRKDVDHILVHSDLLQDDESAQMIHDRVKQFANSLGLSIKYHGGDEI